MKHIQLVPKVRKFKFSPILALCLSFLVSTSHAQITPLSDSYINTASPTKNFGAQTVLDVDGASQITYIEFNLASIPTTASISQATLKLYVNSVTTAGSFNVDYVSANWAESTIDAGNAPPLGAAIASNINVTTADKNQYILVNVTSAVQAWLGGNEPNYGVALVANSSFNATFDSKESKTTSHPAELDIVYAGGNGTITGVTTASGSGLIGGGTSGTLNLSLTNTCAAKQILAWNGRAWACSSAGTGTITGVTAGTDLTGGGTSGTVTLSLDATKVPQLGTSNTFGGNNTFSVSNTDAIDAYTSGPGKTAVVALQYATSGGSYGVYAFTYDPTGAGVAGINYSTSGYAAGVLGRASYAGVEGVATNSEGTAIVGYGYNAPSGSGAIGGEAAVFLGGNGDPNKPSGGGDGVDAYGGTGSLDVQGGIGGTFEGGNGSNPGDGINAYSNGGYAGYFGGDVWVEGSLSKSGGSFKIDHPLDPANKYLYHSFVESPDMKNIYDGVATLDANGEAVIQMPDWFGVLNRDFRYQLTCIGGFSPVFIAEELANNQFKIGGGRPGMRVSWQITGIRQDAWANAHRIPVEEEKETKLKGFYIHPELYGAPAEKQIEWGRHPLQMKKMKERRQQTREGAQLREWAARPQGNTN